MCATHDPFYVRQQRPAETTCCATGDSFRCITKSTLPFDKQLLVTGRKTLHFPPVQRMGHIHQYIESAFRLLSHLFIYNHASPLAPCVAPVTNTYTPTPSCSHLVVNHWQGPRPAVTAFQKLNAPPVVPEGFEGWSEVMDTWGNKVKAKHDTKYLVRCTSPFLSLSPRGCR